MPSYSRELTLLGLLSATLVLPQCSLLTKVDWTAIPAAGGASDGGSSGETIGGEAGAKTEAGEAGTGGFAGEAGESGAGGAAGELETGGTGDSGGNAGRGGTGGTGGGTGGSGDVGGMPGHTTCTTAPTPPAVIPDLSQFIVLFDGGAVNGGALSGRAGLDAQCKKAKDALALPHSAARGVISVEAKVPFDVDYTQSDQIVNMASKYKIPGDFPAVKSAIGMDFAPSWNDIWKHPGAIPSLVCSGVMPATQLQWLTGTSGKGQPLEMMGSVPGPNYWGYLDASSDLMGSVFANACDGWTTGTASLTTKAHVGSTIADRDPGSDGHPRFVDWLNVECNAVKANLLCVAFEPAP